jgi:hypothetical protein
VPPLTDLDEQLAHQLPEPFPNVQTHHPHWRESYFFIAHQREALGDVVILTMATFPQRQTMDSIQMGRVDDAPVISFQARAYDGDPHTTVVGGASVEIVKPYEEIRLRADPDVCELGMDLLWRARTKPYGLRRGTMRAAHELVWDQSHMFQSGTYSGTYSHGGTTHEVDDWWGQRDHSWGIRDHGRCPLWLWFQVQLPDGFLGVWHWELANGARVFTDGCWAPADGGEPVPLVDFAHDVEWVDADGKPATYGSNGESVAGLRGTATFVLAGGQRVVVEADGRFDRPYEPFQRGGLSQMMVTTDDGRTGTAIFEVTGAQHHRYFPDTTPPGILPS